MTRYDHFGVTPRPCYLCADRDQRTPAVYRVVGRYVRPHDVCSPCRQEWEQLTASSPVCPVFLPIALGGVAVGDRVRVLDAPPGVRDDDYAEGVVEGFVRGDVGGPRPAAPDWRYKVAVRRRVYRGYAVADETGGYVYPPVNGEHGDGTVTRFVTVLPPA